MPERRTALPTRPDGAALASRFLGLLRKAQSAPVQAVVGKELNKDLIHESNAEITLRMFGTDD